VVTREIKLTLFPENPTNSRSLSTLAGSCEIIYIMTAIMSLDMQLFTITK